MKENKMRKEVEEIILSFCREDFSELAEDMMIKELGFDSIAYLNLFVEIEQKYDIDIDDLFTESFQTYTVGKFIDMVVEKIK